MPNIALHFEHVLRTSKDTELLYLTLKGYLAFSGVQQVQSNWIPLVLRHEVSSNEATNSDIPHTILPHLKEIAACKIIPLKLDQNLIERTRSYLRTIPLSELTYHELGQIVQDVLLNADFENKVEAILAQGFTSNDPTDSIPVIYTYKGYKKLRTNSKQLLEKASIIHWILGLSKASSNALTDRNLTPYFWSKYSRDYIRHWESYLANIHVYPTDDPQEFLQLLDKLTYRNSPLKTMLQLIEEQTAPIRDPHVFVGQHFSSLNALRHKSAKRLQSLSDEAIISLLNNLKTYMIRIVDAQDFEQNAFDAAKSYLNGQDNPIKQLKNAAMLSPEPLRHWLEDIVNDAMGVLLRGAYPVIDNAWETNVAPIFKSEFKNRFPFTSTSQAVVSLNSLGEFFGEDGIIDHFTQTYLKPFIDTNNSWRPYQFGQYTIGIRTENVRLLEKAAMIKNLYFAHGGKQPSVQFAIKPRHLSNTSSDIFFQYGAQAISYQHGPQQISNWTWPSPGSQQVNVIINDFNGGAYSRSYEGEWAFFKLFSGAKLAAAGPGHFIWTIHEGIYQASFELWTNKTPFLFDLGLFKNLQLSERL